MTSEEKYLIAFSTVSGIGPARLKLLLDYFGSAGEAWESPEGDLTKVGLPKDVLIQLLEQRKKLKVDQYAEGIVKRGIKFVTINDKNYPARLKNIPNLPVVLYFKSNLDLGQINKLTENKIIGVVGTRKITDYGKEVTAKLVTDLVGAGFTIVSGLALGVDGVAHGAALNAGGKTFAVLGAGVEVVYPLAHTSLYNSILEHGGAIISEVAPEKLVARGVFPARNRIISGLSEAVLVTEGAIDSGSLITARAALDQGREVFAVPGPINSPMAEGTNYLLKQGAKLVTGVEDILGELGYEGSPGQTTTSMEIPRGDDQREQTIIDLLVNQPLDFDEISRRSGIRAGQLGALLSGLEIKKKVFSSGLVYRISHPSS